MAKSKSLQLFRNKSVFADKTTAIESLKTKLVTMLAGEPAIASYTDGDSKSILLGIALDDSNYQIFEGSKVKSDGSLEIPEEVKKYIESVISSLKGGVSEEYNTFEKIENIIKREIQKVTNLQAELDKTQTAAGLEADGTYKSETGSNYIDSAVSLKVADKLLDTALKTVSDTVTKNKVVEGNGIAVDASGANTVVSVKVDTADKVLSTSAAGLLANLSLKYIKRTEDTAAKLQLIGKNDTVITDLDATDFVMDGMLEKAELKGDKLTFTFNTDGKKTPIEVDLSKYITVYEAGNGIDIQGQTVSAKVKESENILKVDAEGLHIDATAFDSMVSDSKYKSALPDDLTTPEKHGGLKKGVAVSALKQKTLSQLFDDILFEELEPTVQAPSCAISPKGNWAANGIYEVGTAAPGAEDNFNITFNRGTCSVVGQPNKNRAGAETSRSVQLGEAALNPSQKVTLGQMTYNLTVNYAEGDELVTSKGNKASVAPNPLPVGSVKSSTSIFGTYPYFCNGQNASTSNGETSMPESVSPDTKLPLKKWTDALIGAKFAAESTTGVRLEFLFPSQKNVTKVEFYNTVSGKWEVFASANYAITEAGNKQIQSTDVAYKKLTTTGALSGALQLRFTVADTSRTLNEEPLTYEGEEITDEIFRMLTENSTTVPFVDGSEIMPIAETGNRPSGVASFAVNFEPGGQSPLDARTLVPTKTDLIAPSTYAGKNYYKGMTVTVIDDGGKPNIYILNDVSKITSADYSGWVKQSPESVELTLAGYKRSDSEGDALQLTESDNVVGAFGKLEKAIVDNEETCSKAFDAVRTAVGLSENLAYVAPEGVSYVTTATSVKDADAKLDAAIKDVSDKVNAEQAKNYLTDVIAGNGITVSVKASNSQTITAKVADADPMLEVTADGIKTKDDAVWDCGEY